jgi:hypothetical protein
VIRFGRNDVSWRGKQVVASRVASDWIAQLSLEKHELMDSAEVQERGERGY